MCRMAHPLEEHDLPADEPALTPDELADVEAELSRFAEAEAKRLGLHREQYTEHINTDFTADQRAHTTLLVGGLTVAHDDLLGAGLRGLGYRVKVIDQPNQDALQYGKEFGNRGQCNPTYFNVGNLLRHLIYLRDQQGLSTQAIIDRFLFVAPGACGPCRFGTYVTEYRKALRDAGFDGFRVMLFQQQGGLKQATGQEAGLTIDSRFAVVLVRALVAGDVLNLMGYRLRPYEVVEGSADAALLRCRALVREALEKNRRVTRALLRSRRILASVAVDRTEPKPLVSVIGEFWAMTTEGDGNYHLQRFLEQEGAEVDIQGVTNWILYLIWEERVDTERRLGLEFEDEGARKAQKGSNPRQTLLGLKAADAGVRALFQLYANAVGLHGYTLPDMDHISELSLGFYDREVRGGEGHMEVGKLIHFVEDQINHMTLSVKPFGCMPSSGVSDGVQSLITARWPEAIFLPLETTGDGQVNAHSRVQMMLFKARQRAREEFDRALDEAGLDRETFEARVRGSRRWRTAFWRPKRRTASVVTDLVYAVR